jgi:hypothetical protein
MANNILKVTRSNEIKNDLDQAILWLYNIDFEAGNLIMVNYRTIENKIDSVLALGLKTGRGKDSFKVISATKNNLVWGVFYDPNDVPDVSTLSHEEDFLYHDPRTDTWFIIHNNEDKERIFVEISNIPQTFINLADGTIWVSNEDKRVARINDLVNTYSKEEIDRWIEYARNNPKYVEFENLTTEQINQLKGEKGDQGDKGEHGDQGIQGERGIQGYNGTIDNFVVLSQAEYDALDYVDPNKFYFTYEEDEQTPTGDFYAYVLEHILHIYATASNHILEINSNYTNYDTHILELIQSTTVTPTPIFDPFGGTYDGVQTVVITCPEEDAIIKYTLDRTEPNESSETYNGPLTLDQSTVIKAYAYKPGLLRSRIVEEIYTLRFSETVADPICDYDSGVYDEPFPVTISCSTPDSIIRYTLDGTEPNESSTIYLTP